MESTELIKKVRKIEIRTKALSQQIFSGQYHMPLRDEVWLQRSATI